MSFRRESIARMIIRSAGGMRIQARVGLQCEQALGGIHIRGRLINGGPTVADGRRFELQACLQFRDFGFALLVPGEGASLAVRSGALFDWCRGFVGAFGLAAGAEPPLSEEGREALADLAKLAAATAQEDGDEEDEDALVEIEEFVRVAVLLLHGDCALGPKHRGRLN